MFREKKKSNLEATKVTGKSACSRQLGTRKVCLCLTEMISLTDV